MAKTKRNDVTVQTIDLINAKVSKIYFSNDKVTRGSLDIISESPNKKTIHTFVPFVWFGADVELEEGDEVNTRAHFFTDSYEDKNKTKHYSLGLCIDSCEVIWTNLARQLPDIEKEVKSPT